jgi:hypothetical protein
LDVVSNELDAELASFVTRDSAMQQRATILIGAASIVGALQVDSQFGWATVISLSLSLVAALAGVVVVFPRRGDALDVRSMRDGLLGMPLHEGRYKLIDTKLEVLEADEKWLGVRGLFARLGFIALTLSIVVAVVVAVASVMAPQSVSPAEPSPAHTSEVHHDAS